MVTCGFRCKKIFSLSSSSLCCQELVCGSSLASWWCLAHSSPPSGSSLVPTWCPVSRPPPLPPSLHPPNSAHRFWDSFFFFGLFLLYREGGWSWPGCLLSERLHLLQVRTSTCAHLSICMSICMSSSALTARPPAVRSSPQHSDLQVWPNRGPVGLAAPVSRRTSSPVNLGF